MQQHEAQAELGTFLKAEGTAQIFVSCAEFKAKPNYTRQYQIEFSNKHEEGAGEGGKSRGRGE